TRYCNARAFRISRGERIEPLDQHILNDLGHRVNIDLQVELRLGVESKRMLCDVDRMIADALDLRSSTCRGNHKPQVGGGGLLEDQNVHANLIDVEFHLIDRIVLANDSVCEFGIALEQ